jgi:hypothetical protein
MKNTMRCLGIIVLVAVIGFSFAACGDGSGNGGGGGGGGGSGLTITGLPSGHADIWNVFVFAAGTDISNYDAFDIISGIGNNKIEAANYGGSNNGFFPLVKVKAGGPTGPEDIWTGSGSRSVTLNNGSTADYSWATVNFSNGNGTVQYSSFKPLGSGGEDPGTGTDLSGTSSEANPFPLTAGIWANGSVPSADSVVWCSFNVTGGTTYYIWWNDKYQGDNTKTADVEVSAYYSNGTRIFEEEDSGWNYPESFTASSSGTVKIKVAPYFSSATGTFAIVYSTSSTKPGTGGGGGTDLSGPANWTAVSNSTFTSSIRAVAYGNNRWVAGGNDGTMAYSSDGVTWAAVEDKTAWGLVYNGTTYYEGIDIKAIAYGNNRFVAVGSFGKMAYSTDNGVTWTAVADSPFDFDPSDYLFSSIQGIAYGNNRFVAVSSGGKMAYSSDGACWAAVDSTIWPVVIDGTTLQLGISCIAYGNGRFVAAGSGKMAYSSDGASWTAVGDSTIITDGFTGIYAVAYGNNRWVAVGTNGKTAYSTNNGASWTAVSNSALTSHINGIAYGNNRFVAVSSAKMAYSSDGASWTAAADSVLTSDIYGIAYGNGRFVAGGYPGKMAYADW